MKRCLAMAVSFVVLFTSVPIQSTQAQETTTARSAPLETKRFDFGGGEVEPGYTGVSASEKYSTDKGYGFTDPSRMADVTASGTGAGSDAVRFMASLPFNVDLPVGNYKITVTTGDVTSTTIKAEGKPQLLFLTGNEAEDSFTIPVTDGQLNLYASAGVGSNHSISSLVIEPVPEKQTIWLYGDSTVSNTYNAAEGTHRGWGQVLGQYIDTDRYEIRNMSFSGMSADVLLQVDFFETAETFGKKDDICIFAMGFEDYMEAYWKNPEAPDAADYRKNITELVRRAKEKGMQVYLVKQAGEYNDCVRYPLIQERWFGNTLEEVAAEEDVQVLDLFQSWMVHCLEINYRIAHDYYIRDGLHMNDRGAQKQAQMIAELLFAPPVIQEPVVTPEPDKPNTVIYQTEVSGGPVPNPHKGFIMTTYHPGVFEASYEYGRGGSKGNHAWDVVTMCNGVHYWKDINPADGVYDWKEIDDMLDACEKYGMTYVIRILPYSSLSGSDDNYGADHDFVPQWVYKKGAKKQRVHRYEDPSIALDAPKWDDPVYLEACKALATALAEHFDGDPRVEFIDIRPFGNWGEWHFSQVVEKTMPSVEIQKDMLKHYADAFEKTTLAVPSDAYGEVYEYALSLGISKRNDGLIGSVQEEWDLRLTYKANLPVLAENAGTYSGMLQNEETPYGPLKWTPLRFREVIEIGHLTATALDQDNQCGYRIYKEQKELIDEMVNRIGYNFTVTSAKRYNNTLTVTIKNTGVAPAFFAIDLCAEITDSAGNKIKNFGTPIRIEKGSFHDETEQTFVFTYDGTLQDNDLISLSMYDSDNPLVKGKNPTVRFDNKNAYATNRLALVVDHVVPGVPFTDVASSDWYYNAVRYVYENKIMTGKSNKTFAPGGTLTRGMMATILWNMAGKPKVSGSVAFPDVKSTDYYYKAVLWAKKNKVINGYADGTFGPKDPVTRVQAMVIFWNYAKKQNKNVNQQADLKVFTDAEKIPTYAKEAVQWAVGQKIITGKENGTLLDPYGVATRAAIAVMAQAYETKVP